MIYTTTWVIAWMAGSILVATGINTMFDFTGWTEHEIRASLIVMGVSMMIQLYFYSSRFDKLYSAHEEKTEKTKIDPAIQEIEPLGENQFYIGETLYETEIKIGEGSFGAVYLGKCLYIH